ncbi:hypothetical protein SDC9_108221 [bioreactor metagenome]|uniref:Uncharacterized protein n=1 Tax=bioreactor metagenome TaxID=1076179 RepID=A0A645BDV6_9ZZZZ
MIVVSGDDVFGKPHAHQYRAAFFDDVYRFGVGIVNRYACFSEAQMFYTLFGRTPVYIHHGDILGFHGLDHGGKTNIDDLDGFTEKILDFSFSHNMLRFSAATK